MRVTLSEVHTSYKKIIKETLKQSIGRNIDFQNALCAFPACCSTMKVSILANHDSSIFGVSDNLHFTELFEILQDPSPPRISFLASILNPSTITIIQNDANNGIH